MCNEKKCYIKENIKNFNKYGEDTIEHRDYNLLYDEVYNYYINKDKNFIKIEKVRLQAKIGKYNSDSKNVTLSLAGVAIGFLISGFVTIFGCFIPDYFNGRKVLITLLAIYIIIISFLVYIIKKDKNTIIFGIALQVLDDIEKEKLMN